MNRNEELETLVNKYLKKPIEFFGVNDIFTVYYIVAKDIISDIGYFSEHIQRVSKSKYTNYNVLPDLKGSHGHFVSDLFRYYPVCKSTMPEEIQPLLVIHDLALKMMQDINKDQNSEIYTDYAILRQICWDYSTIDLSTYVSDFVACSQGATFVYSKLQEHNLVDNQLLKK